MSLLLPDTVLPDGLTLEEQREACRALKGSMLRQEVYADDAPQNATKQQRDRAATPYTVAEQNFTIRRVQRRGANRHGVFFTHAREALTFHYERNPSDPRTQHAFTLKVDDFGNVLTEAAVGYGRRADDASLPEDEDREKQRLIHITCTENLYTNAVEGVDTYRAPLAAEAATFELRKPRQEKSADGPTTLFAFDAVLVAVRQSADGQHEVHYEDLEFSGASDPAKASHYFRRCIEKLRTLYRSDDLASTGRPKGLLPLLILEPLALPGESYKLAFTPGLIDQVFQRQPDGALIPDPAAVLGGQGGDRGGYVSSQVLKADGRFPATEADDHWWLPSGRSFFTTDHDHSAATSARRLARTSFWRGATVIRSDTTRSSTSTRPTT